MANVIKVHTSYATGDKDFEIEDVVFGEHSFSGVSITREQQIAYGFYGVPKEVLKSAEEYNATIHRAFDTPGFRDFFLKHEQHVSKDEVMKDFGKEFADNLFSLQSPAGAAQFKISGDYLFSEELDCIGSFDVEGQHFSFSVPYVKGDAYHHNGLLVFYEWSDNFSFFGHGLYCQFVADHLANEASEWYQMDYAIQDKVEADAFILGQYALKQLKMHGYAREYLLVPEKDDDAWIWKWKNWSSEPWIRFLIVDPAYKKDKLLADKIKSLYSVFDRDEENDCYKADNVFVNDDGTLNLSRKFYYLQDEDNHTYLSLVPGTFGGHYKLKIYGRLDCPSALRYIQKGQYVDNRVFFKDEQTAIHAGYRPCGICMKEKYKQWKMIEMKK